MLAEPFKGRKPDTTEENIQSRIRGAILMAISNKFGPMVLTTGNKSEMSVGYATLYGDMCGGYNVLKDLYKTQVFALSRWRNQSLPKGALGPAGRVMPERVIEKPPTAELRANQKDEDSLPPYAVLDGILECLVEQEMGFEDIVAKGYDPRDRQARRAAALRRRIQAPAGPTRGQAQRAQFRPRPPLSHHQRLPRRALMDEAGQTCYAPARKETPVRFIVIIRRTIAICG